MRTTYIFNFRLRLPCPLFSTNRLGVFGRGKTVVVFELAGEVMDGGVAQTGGDLGEIQVALPNEGLAFVQLHTADIVSGREAHLLTEQGGQVGGADIGLLCHDLHGKLVIHMGADIFQSTGNDGVFVPQSRGGLQTLFPTEGIPKDGDQQKLQVGTDGIIGVLIRLVCTGDQGLEVGGVHRGQIVDPVAAGKLRFRFHIKGHRQETGIAVLTCNTTHQLAAVQIARRLSRNHKILHILLQKIRS